MFFANNISSFLKMKKNKTIKTMASNKRTRDEEQSEEHVQRQKVDDFKEITRKIYGCIDETESLPLETFKMLPYFDRLRFIDIVISAAGKIYEHQFISYLLSVTRLKITGSNFKSGLQEYKVPIIFNLYNVLVVSPTLKSFVRNIITGDEMLFNYCINKQIIEVGTLIDQMTTEELQTKLIGNNYDSPIFRNLFSMDSVEILQKVNQKIRFSCLELVKVAINFNATECINFLMKNICTMNKSTSNTNIINWFITHDEISLIPFIPHEFTDTKQITSAITCSANGKIKLHINNTTRPQLVVACGELLKKWE